MDGSMKKKVIVVIGSKRYTVQASNLMMISNFFATMLSREWKETSEGVINLTAAMEQDLITPSNWELFLMIANRIGWNEEIASATAGPNFDLLENTFNYFEVSAAHLLKSIGSAIEEKDISRIKHCLFVLNCIQRLSPLLFEPQATNALIHNFVPSLFLDSCLRTSTFWRDLLFDVQAANPNHLQDLQNLPNDEDPEANGFAAKILAMAVCRRRSRWARNKRAKGRKMILPVTVFISQNPFIG